MKLLFLVMALVTSFITRTCNGFSAPLCAMTRFRTVLPSSKSKDQEEEIFERNEVEEEIAAEDTARRSFSTVRGVDENDLSNTVDRDPLPVHKSIQQPAGLLCDDHDLCVIDDTTNILPHIGRSRKRVLVLCTGGTLTMCHDPTQNNSLAPVQGALTAYLASMRELTDDPEMPVRPKRSLRQ